MRASEIRKGDTFRDEYTVEDVLPLMINGTEHVVALVRYSADGGMGQRLWLPTDETPLTHPTEA